MQRLLSRSGANGDTASGEAIGSLCRQRRGHEPERVVAVDVALTLILASLLTIIYAGTFGTDAADDVFFGQAIHGTYDLALANYVNGRFIPGAVFQLLVAVGIEIHHIWTALQLVAIGSIAAFSVVFVTRLALPLTYLEILTFSGLIAAFPYMVNLIANKNNAVNATLAYAAAAAAVYFHGKLRGWGRVAVPAFFLFVCVSSYQTTVYYFVVFVFGLQIFHGADRRDTLLSLASGGVTCAIALVAYFIVYQAIMNWALLEMAQSGNPELVAYYGNPRSHLNDLNGFMVAALLYIFSVARVLFAPEPILPLTLKALAITTFLASFIHWKVHTPPGTMHSASETFVYRKQRLMVLALVAATGSPIHLVIANKWLAPRVLAHAGATWAVLLIAALVLGPAKWRSRILLCVVILVLGFSSITHTIIRDAQRLNYRDVALAREIFAELKRTPKFDPDLPVAVIGLLDSKSSYMANTWSYYNLNTSKFGNEWSKRIALQSAAGRTLVLPDPAFNRFATDLCATGNPGGTHYKTMVTSRGAAVCLE